MKARGALELSPESLERALILVDEPNVYCWLGDRERAIEQLEKLVKLPTGLTFGDMRFNPAWDSLRDDPRFARMIAEVAAPIPLL